ncbi:MAG TPA: lytic murein transglycosylase [Candidatus Portnoybacteria bacterium]|jgi:peptidoglycan hydrolase CwlO-like protein|nr:lytic murein transglycosylase [Candidatus Portnoybacteria bacterium]MDD5752111.1 lytic murein transglycosylase [Candidatus Portnoybacteria bacterium]HOZ16602.1 lytic murein transglycosylase [Candidatus Portnoybacteria bacterium]HPH52378.1 lytic murein transglycosylase [Candidatus Portnoybacteria bacterium]HPM28301.1 lytic murein transglycosylase [Candidatus Portnoybacteria bacterium]
MIKLKKLNKLTLILAIILLLMGFTPLMAELFVFAEISADLNAQEVEAEAKLKDLELKISQYREAISENQQKVKSLKTEITIFDDQIKSLELEIQRTELLTKKLDKQINSKEKSIREIEREFDLEKTTLAELAREIRKYDDKSFLEVLLNKDNFSDFIAELKSLEDFNNQVQEELKKITKAKTELEKEKEDLTNEKEELAALKKLQDQQKIDVEKTKKERKTLLEQTKGQENLFNQLLKKTKSDIEAIKNKLYFLEGLVSDGALRFEDAYRFAKYAGTYTGIRPAFLLAILSRESELGKNIGKGSWRVDMKPSQRQYYLQICRELEIDPDKYPVSKKQWYGWGGAMGPAQIMPATWLGYKAKIIEITGNDPPSPWNVKDAFVASALYLVNKGAGEKTTNAEWKAAMMYLAGANWKKDSLRFYGDQVMDLTKQFQEQIDILEKE